MPVSSAIINIKPNNSEKIVKELQKLKGVEVHKYDNSKIIVVIEAGTIEEEYETAKKITAIKEVVSFNITYHAFEDDI